MHIGVDFRETPCSLNFWCFQEKYRPSTHEVSRDLQLNFPRNFKCFLSPDIFVNKTQTQEELMVILFLLSLGCTWQGMQKTRSNNIG